MLSVVLVRSLRGNKEEEAVPVDHETVYYEGVVLFDEKEQLPEYSAPANAQGADEKKDATAAAASADN